MGLQTHYCSCQKSIKKGPMNPICLHIGGASHHLDSREEFRLAFQRFLQPWVIDNIVLIIILTSELSLSRCYS